MWDKAIAKLSSVLKGTLILPSHDRYDTSRRIYNRRIDRRPAMVACCACENDVAWCVRVAKEYGIPLSVRAGGHSPAGFSVIDGGLIIDLSRMKELHIDVEAYKVVVATGARWSNLDRATARIGLVAVGGHQLQVGVSGLVLVGGWGVLSRLLGLAADNLLQARIVGADGEIHTVSEKEMPDLFWALKGAGAGHFGVVTSLCLRLHSLPPKLKGGIAIYSIDTAAKVLPALLAYMQDGAPRELGIFGSLRHYQGAPVFMLVYHFCGDPDEADHAIAPLLQLAQPIVNESYLSYLEFKEHFSATVPQPQNALWKSGLVDAPFDETAISKLVECCKKAPSELGRINFEIINGAIHDTAPGATAFAHRSQLFCVTVVALWELNLGEEVDQFNQKWVRDTYDTISPLLSGRVYPGYTDSDLTNFGQAYWGENYPSLCKIKQKWDPDRIFGVEQIIGG